MVDCPTSKIIQAIIISMTLISCAHMEKNKPGESFEEHYQRRLREIESIKTAQFVIIGDSLVEQGNFGSVANFGIGGDCVLGVYSRLQHVLDIKPSTCYVLVGTNDTASKDAQEIIQYINKILDKLIFSGIHPVFITIPYVTFEYENSQSKNSKIREINQTIKSLYSHIDLATLTEKDGFLNPDLTTDGIHLNQKGYTPLLNEISKHNQVIL